MSVLKSSELRDMSPEEREKKLHEMRDELMHERGVSAMGGSPADPGRTRVLRRSIARILTIQKEEHQ